MTGTTDDFAVDVEKLSMGDADIDRVREVLANSDSLDRDRAADACLACSQDDVESVLPLVPTLTAVLEEDDPTVVLKVASTLGVVADRRPDAIVDAVGPLCALLTDDLPKIRVAAANALRPVGQARPMAFTSHVDALVAALTADELDPTSGAEQLDAAISDRQFRQQLTAVQNEERRRQHEARDIAKGLLLTVADHDPATVAPHASAIVDLLTTPDDDLVACAAAVLGYLAEADPEAVEGAVEPLIDCLSRADDAVPAHAIHALGHLDDGAAVEPLRDLAAADGTSKGVRELAAETADWLARDR